MAQLIGMKAIKEHFKGQIGENKIREWIKDYDFPAIKSSGDRGLIMADSEAVDQWFICFTLKQSFSPIAAEMITERLTARPELPVKTRGKHAKGG